jgi:hypothetical protein
MLAVLRLLGVEPGYAYVGASCQHCGSLADLYAELMTQDTRGPALYCIRIRPFLC